MSTKNNKREGRMNLLSWCNTNFCLLTYYNEVDKLIRTMNRGQRDLNGVYSYDDQALRGLEFYFEYATGCGVEPVSFDSSLSLIRQIVMRHIVLSGKDVVDSELFRVVSRASVSLEAYMSGDRGDIICDEGLHVTKYLGLVGAEYEALGEERFLVTRSGNREEVLLKSFMRFVRDWRVCGYAEGNLTDILSLEDLEISDSSSEDESEVDGEETAKRSGKAIAIRNVRRK